MFQGILIIKVLKIQRNVFQKNVFGKLLYFTLESAIVSSIYIYQETTSIFLILDWIQSSLEVQIFYICVSSSSKASS